MTANIKINKSLLPFSWLYGLGIWIRNKLFDWGIFSVEEFSIPVISVGNITVGGTGKTPHTEYLVRLLSPYAKIAVLSRGYKRKSSGFVLADNFSNSKILGDEPYQMHRKFPEIVVAVDTNRKRGIAKLLELPKEKRPDIVLLDDAFQHRHVKPTLSILLVDSNRLIYEDALLPAGRLREPAKNKSRADLIITTKCPIDFKPIDYRVIGKHLELFPYQSLFFTSFKYGKLIPVFNSLGLQERTLEEIKSKKTKVLLVAGIASPDGLISELKNYSDTVETILFPDHHSFSNKDIQKIQQDYENIPGSEKVIITTEKDAVRLIDYPEMDAKIKNALYYLPIEVVFSTDQEELFKQKIEEHVRNVKRNRVLA